MGSPIQQIFALCKQIIGKHSSEKLTKEVLSPIISSLNKITKNDICFCPDEFRTQDSRKTNAAPVSYMELYRDRRITMAVFIVKSGSSLPLHDHPNMFGLLKVIHGSVKLLSYNESKFDSGPSNEEIGQLNIKPVIRNPDLIITDKDECCVLTPSDGNIHGIHSLSDFSAFLDILTPSYGNDSSCHYYEEIENPSDSNTRWLMETGEPTSYWCDPFPYKGPRLV